MKILGIFLLASVALGAEPMSLVLKVDNMTCSGCVYTVKYALKKVKGVQEVKVSLQPPEARVTFDPSKATPIQLVEATTKYGYPSMVLLPISESDLPDSQKDKEGISVLKDDDNSGGILVDPHKIDVLALLQSIRASDVNKDNE